MIKLNEVVQDTESVEGTHYIDKVSKCGRYLRIMDTDSLDTFTKGLGALKRDLASGKYTEHEDGSFTLKRERTEIEFE